MDKQTKKRITLFIILTFTATWGLVLIMHFSGVEYGSAASTVFLMGAMFLPALCSLLTRVLTREGFKDMLLRPRLKGNVVRYIFAAYFPIALIILGAVLYFIFFFSELDPSCGTLTMALLSTGVPADSLQTMLIVQLAGMIVISPFVNLLPTLGEELGWRAYLLPKLLALGERKALLVTGAVWGVWHAPMIALGHNYGLDYPGAPWLGILLMILFCMAFGVFEGYLTLKVGSVWPAALAHSAINAFSAAPIYFCFNSSPLLGPCMTGIISMLPAIAVALILLKKAKAAPCRPDKNTGTAG